MIYQLQGLLGLAALPLIAFALSENRGAVANARTLKLILAGVAIQVALAAALMNIEALRIVFEWPARAIDALQEATLDGVRLVFGYLAGGPAPFDTVKPGNGFVLAFQALPLILMMSVLSKLLYHWGILPRIVDGFAYILNRTLGVSGPVATGAAANVFVGMVEAPLLIRPYLARMTRAELFATMTVGMAGIAGTVLALYASVLKNGVPGAAGHLIVASVMSVPAALVISALMVPETATSSAAATRAADADPNAPHSSMDAIAQGTREGVELLASVTAMLIVAVALVSLTNAMLGALSAPFGVTLSLQKLLGLLFAPLAWLTGVPASESAVAGGLLGVKTVLNELLAYLEMAALPADALSPRSRLIMTYALCGFANLGSLGILVGGLVAMVPERRAEIVDLGMRTIAAGTLATLMTAAVVGVVSFG